MGGAAALHPIWPGSPVPDPPSVDMHPLIRAAMKRIMAHRFMIKSPRAANEGKELRMSIWEQMQSQGVTTTGEGTFVVAPGHRMHLTMSLRMEELEGKMEVVCDGTTLWEIYEGPDKTKWEARKVKLPKI